MVELEKILSSTKADKEISAKREVYMASFKAWLANRWWSLLVAFVVGLAVLPICGYMSPSKHQELQNKAVVAAVDPLLPAACAVEYASHPDYSKNRAVLEAAQKGNKTYEVRNEIESRQTDFLKKHLTWSATDRCAKIVLEKMMPAKDMAANIAPSGTN
jgi:hypothetical protein